MLSPAAKPEPTQNAAENSNTDLIILNSRVIFRTINWLVLEVLYIHICALLGAPGLWAKDAGVALAMPLHITQIRPLLDCS